LVWTPDLVKSLRSLNFNEGQKKRDGNPTLHKKTRFWRDGSFCLFRGGERPLHLKKYRVLRGTGGAVPGTTCSLIWRGRSRKKTNLQRGDKKKALCTKIRPRNILSLQKRIDSIRATDKVQVGKKKKKKRRAQLNTQRQWEKKLYTPGKKHSLPGKNAKTSDFGKTGALKGTHRKKGTKFAEGKTSVVGKKSRPKADSDIWKEKMLRGRSLLQARQPRQRECLSHEGKIGREKGENGKRKAQKKPVTTPFTGAKKKKTKCSPGGRSEGG